MVMFRHGARGLGRIVHVKKGDDAEWAGRCEARTSGDDQRSGRRRRRRGGEGGDDPASLGDLTVHPRQAGAASISDQDGRFTVQDLPIGIDYNLSFLGASPISASQGRVAQESRRRTRPDDRCRRPSQSRARSWKRGSPLRLKCRSPGGSSTSKAGRSQGALVTIEVREKPDDGDLTAWLEASSEASPTSGREASETGSPRLEVEGEPDQDRRRRAVSVRRRAGRSGRRDDLDRRNGRAQEIDVVTRATAPFTAQGFSTQYGPKPSSISTASISPAPPLPAHRRGRRQGRRDRAADRRSRGQEQPIRRRRLHGMTALKTRTDDKGRFRMTGMPKGKDNVILIVPVTDQPYFIQEVPVPDPAGIGTGKARRRGA